MKPTSMTFGAMYAQFVFALSSKICIFMTTETR